MQILVILSTYVAIQMKDSEQYFHVILFSMLYKVILTSKSVGQTVKCEHSNESYWAALSGRARNVQFGNIHYIWTKLILGGKSVKNVSLYIDLFVRFE